MVEETESACEDEEFRPSDYYNFYAAYGSFNMTEAELEPESEPEFESSESETETEPAEQETQEVNLVMIAEGQSCNTDNTWINYFESAVECAKNVMNAGSQYFIYDTSDGDCRYFAITTACEGGLSDSYYYDFYAVYGYEAESVPEEETEPVEEETPEESDPVEEASEPVEEETPEESEPVEPDVEDNVTAEDLSNEDFANDFKKSGRRL